MKGKHGQIHGAAQAGVRYLQDSHNFASISLGFWGGGGVGSLPDVLKHLVKCLMGDSRPPTLRTLCCQPGEDAQCKKPREM